MPEEPKGSKPTSTPPPEQGNLFRWIWIRLVSSYLMSKALELLDSLSPDE